MSYRICFVIRVGGLSTHCTSHLSQRYIYCSFRRLSETFYFQKEKNNTGYLNLQVTWQETTTLGMEWTRI